MKDFCLKLFQMNAFSLPLIFAESLIGAFYVLPVTLNPSYAMFLL